MKNILNIKIPIKLEMSYGLLKYLAIITMTYDHVLKYIFGINPNEIVLFPGRFAFPLFVFMIAYNLSIKQNFVKYFIRLAPFALISYCVTKENYTNFPALNIMYTFMISIFIIYLLEFFLKKEDKKFTLFIGFLILLCFFSVSFFFEYGFFGVCFFISLYYFARTRYLIVGLLSVFLILTWMPSLMYSVLIIPFGLFLLFIEPVPNKNYSSFYKTGWIFYAYYPFHFWLIAIIRNYL